MGRKRRLQLVVVATAARLQEADVIRAVLQGHDIKAFVLEERASNLLSHMALAIHPAGIPIAVRRRDLRRARAVLAELPSRTGTPRAEGADVGRSTPDEYAQRAYRSALYSAWFPPLAILTFYYFIQARRAAAKNPVRQPELFRKRLLIAFFLGVLLPVGGMAAIINLGLFIREPPAPSP